MSRLSAVLAALRGASSNGNGHEAKSGVTISPGLGFHSPDGMRTIIQLVGGGNSEAERVSAQTAYAAAAYAFAAMRWRASCLRQAPLMVVEEDQDTGDEEWLPKHPLADLLMEPSPDFDMGELLFRTSVYVDRDGHALWTKDKDLRGRPGRLTPFAGNEFEVESTSERIRGLYRLTNAQQGRRTRTPEEVVYFHETNPADWLRGLSRLEVYLGWLNLGQVARATVRDLLQNAVWPSIVLMPDKDWNPTTQELAEYQAKANSYSQPGKKGGALAMVGGGSAEVVSARIRDLVPNDILNRVEAIAASVFGAPAVVLQFLVGLENSPWSQMADARRMGYEDTIEPMWNDIAAVLTRQLLRPIDPDPTHFVRFDTSKIRALQADRQVQASIAVQVSRIASVNERRAMMGLEPSDDPKANDIPELTQPDPMALGAGLPGEDDEEDTEDEKRWAPMLAALARHPEMKRDLWAALRADQAERAVFDWQLESAKQLRADADEVARLARRHLAGEKAEQPSDHARKTFLTAVLAYLAGPSQERWKRAMEPLAAKHALNGARAVIADLGISLDLVRPDLIAYAKREAAWLVKGISETTREKVQSALSASLEEGLGARAIASRMADLPAFSKDRALLVARTEATRVTNGAPTEALLERQRTTGTRFTKTWSTALDARVRDEHAAMEGETVSLDAAFSNGLMFPGEPNCRCVVTYAVVED